MRQWVALAPLVALVVAGCMADASTQSVPNVEDDARTFKQADADAEPPTTNASPATRAHQPPAHHADAADPAYVVWFDAPLFIYSHVAVDWQRVAAVLPPGFTPAGHPYVPLVDQYWGAPNGTVANVMLAVFPYTAAGVDDVVVGAGRAAFAWATVVPPETYGHLYPADVRPGAPGYLWLGAVVTDTALAEALGAWQAPVSAGSVEIELGDDPHLRAAAKVSGRFLNMTLDVPQPTLSPTATGPEVDLVNFIARGRQVVEALNNRLDPHKALIGPSIASGTIGPLGEITAAGAYARINWFDADALTPSDGIGRFTFERAPLTP